MKKFTVRIEFTVEADHMEMIEAVVDMDDAKWKALATKLLARGERVRITLEREPHG